MIVLSKVLQVDRKSAYLVGGGLASLAVVKLQL